MESVFAVSPAGAVPCVNAGDDINHGKRPTKQLGARLGWWCATCTRERVKAKRLSARLSRLERVYGLTDQEVAAIRSTMPLNAAGVPVCPGCLTATGASKALATDHDHDLEAAGVPIRDTVRGFLCSTCNQMIEKYGVAGLLRLIAYLQDPPAPKALAALDEQR
jgi:recombination endonuclease VII